MDYKVFIPVLISFVLSVILGPLVIPVLRRLKMDQTEREDGVQSHLKKTGTPTMGGVMILLAVVITSVIYIGRYPKIIPILFLTLGFGLIGFLDDYSARDLIYQLSQCDNPYNCPHGRPVLVNFTKSDMEKMFRRIQENHTSLRELGKY